MRRPFLSSKGLSLIELMVALAIISVGMLGFVGAFSYLSKAITNARARTIASNLAQEKQESLKKISYYRLVVTTSPAYALEDGADLFEYDEMHYPSEDIVVAGTPFIRRVLIEKVQESGGNFAPVVPTDPDTGMKRITVYVMWRYGQTYNVQEVRSLYSNPSRQALESTLKGDVSDTLALPLEGARVECLQNTSFYGEGDSAGDYQYFVTPGTYTLRASLYGYYTAYSSSVYVAEGSTVTVNFSLGRIGVGAVSGLVWSRDHLVLSKVVGSTPSAGFNQEYVEVFNPTTYSWLMQGQIGLRFRRWEDGAAIPIQIMYGTPTVPSGAYYLFANTSPIRAAGVETVPDALWVATSTWNDAQFQYFSPTDPNVIPTDAVSNEGEGALTLYKLSNSASIDTLGWNRSAQSAPAYEGLALQESIGLQTEEQYLRKVSTEGYSSLYGAAYDTAHNARDWTQENPLTYAPRNSLSGTFPVIAGTPMDGAVVSAPDGLSSPTTAQRLTGTGTYPPPYAEFVLVGVATGTYDLAIASGTAYREIQNVGVTQNTTTYVPNAATTPAWPDTDAYDVHLDEVSVEGFLSGKVMNAFGGGLTGKDVEAGGSMGLSGGGGSYILAVPSGTYTVSANPASGPNYDSSYVSLSSAGVVVTVGQISSGLNFYLSQGGGLSGFVSTNGTDPLPNVVVLAMQSGIERGSDLSATDGTFTIVNLATGSYTVEPQLDTGESVSPSSPTAVVSLGLVTFVSTFTVSGAFGTIAGDLDNGGDAITTGVLVVASTATISSSPPTDNSALRSGSVIYYATSSEADGTFSLLVRGGQTYNVYAWFTTWSGGSPTTVRKDASVSVSAGTVHNQDFSWP